MTSTPSDPSKTSGQSTTSAADDDSATITTQSGSQINKEFNSIIVIMVHT